jgi:hypothetical protein
MTLLSPNAANILRWCLHLRSRDIDDKGRDKAAQLYMLAGSFPAIPAGILLDLVEGRTTADAVLAASSFPICQGCADGIGGAAGGNPDCVLHGGGEDDGFRVYDLDAGGVEIEIPPLSPEVEERLTAANVYGFRKVEPEPEEAEVEPPVTAGDIYGPDPTIIPDHWDA